MRFGAIIFILLISRQISYSQNVILKNPGLAQPCLTEALSQACSGQVPIVFRHITGIYADINSHLASIYLEYNNLDSAFICIGRAINDAKRFRRNSILRYSCGILGQIDNILLACVIAIILILGILPAFWIRRKRDIIYSMTKDMAKHSKQLNDSLNCSQKIQNAVFPNFEGVIPCCEDKFIIFKNKQVVSGNCYSGRLESLRFHEAFLLKIIFAGIFFTINYYENSSFCSYALEQQAGGWQEP